MKTLLALTALAILLASGTNAEAVTVRDLIELARAGLTDDVLVALIETDPSMPRPDAQEIVALRAAGLSERVIIAMLGVDRAAQADHAPPRSDASVNPDRARERAWPEHHSSFQTATVVIVPTVPSSVWLPVWVVPSFRVNRSPTRSGADGSKVVIIGVPPDRRAGRSSEPEYWGWGGKRRPDTWNRRN